MVRFHLGLPMTREEKIVQLEIERLSFQEVIRQFTMHDCDARMWCELDEFLKSIERKIEDINRAIAQLVRAHV